MMDLWSGMGKKQSLCSFCNTLEVLRVAHDGVSPLEIALVRSVRKTFGEERESGSKL